LELFARGGNSRIPLLSLKGRKVVKTSSPLGRRKYTASDDEHIDRHIEFPS
jgi:hypothetical protein